jgi:hypothetical protein
LTEGRYYEIQGGQLGEMFLSVMFLTVLIRAPAIRLSIGDLFGRNVVLSHDFSIAKERSTLADLKSLHLLIGFPTAT